jgi:hypothetical protein
MATSSILPAQFGRALGAVGSLLERGESAAPAVAAAVEALSELHPSTISQVAPIIRDTAKLRRWRPRPSFFQTLFRPPLSDKEQLLRNPDLAYLFLFHSDGRIREHALLRISGGLPSPFFFAAVAYRLNDWAEPVRAAAFACAARCFPQTAVWIIVAAAEALLLRQDSWRRWGRKRDIVETTFARADVATALADFIGHSKTGASSRILRFMLRRDVMDEHLLTLATEAFQPTVRALAAETLASGKAKWVVGSEWKWVNKPHGLGARVPTYEYRPLSGVHDTLSLIERASWDRSPMVRRAALDAMIQDRLHGQTADRIAARLLTDKSTSIRERAAFILARHGTTEA